MRNKTISEEIHEKLAQNNIRIFSINLNDNEFLVIHPNKTVSEWRKDIREIINELGLINKSEECSSENLLFEFEMKLLDYGYDKIEEIVSDTYEGKITSLSSKIIEDPAHEQQKDGFGHWGHESKSIQS